MNGNPKRLLVEGANDLHVVLELMKQNSIAWPKEKPHPINNGSLETFLKATKNLYDLN